MIRWAEVWETRCASLPSSIALLSIRIAATTRLRSHLATDVTAAMNAKLLEDVVHVILHGRELDVQSRHDLLVGKAEVEELHDLELARGELHLTQRRRVPCGERRHPSNDAGGHPRGTIASPRATLSMLAIRSSAEPSRGK